MNSMMEKIAVYFSTRSNEFLIALREHIVISLISLCVAILIGAPLGIFCAKYRNRQKWIVGFFQVLRIVPSLAILVLLIPIMGTGERPAVTALVLLAAPPVLMNTVAGLEVYKNRGRVVRADLRLFAYSLRRQRRHNHTHRQ